MDWSETMEAMAQARRQPHELLGRVLCYEYSFATGHWPHESMSDADPPARADAGPEVTPIDGYLGLYDPVEMRIIVFSKGIGEAAALLKRREPDLRYVVRIHEYAHALLHLGLTRQQHHDLLSRPEAVLPGQQALSVFRSIDDGVHDILAQLLTFRALRRAFKEATIEQARSAVQSTLGTFGILAKRQPVEYDIEPYMEVPEERVRKAFALLKKGSLPGRSDLWSTVLTW
jgi:hypothetical protein